MQTAAATHTQNNEVVCTCGEDHDGDLSEELAFMIHFLCERIQKEKDACHVLALMNAVKAGTEAIKILSEL